MISVAGNGLITLPDSSHHRHRKAIAPAFQLHTINSFIPTIAEEGRNLAKALENLSHSGGAFDALAVAEIAVSRAVYRTVLESTATCISQEEIDRIGVKLREGTKLLMYVALRPWLWRSDLCFRLLSPGIFKEKQRMFNELDGVVRCALDWKEGQLRGNREGSDKEMLGHILTNEEAALIYREELIGDLKHLLMGGIGTSADLLSFLMLALALTPDVQDKVHQELDEVFADDPSRLVTAADLPRLRYLEMTIKEVLRYFPLVPIIARDAADDVTLPSGTVVPRGSMVVIFPNAVHMDPRWYPDPRVFNPDRHKPEVASTRPYFTYIPFAAGTRGCIGQRYGMVLSKTIASTVLRKYRCLPAPSGAQRLCDIKLVMDTAVHMQGGANVRVERR